MDIFSICKQKRPIYIIFGLLLSLSAAAQGLNARFLAYIEQYKEVAMEHCRVHGVPASITLAQGLLESNAGSSYLATRGNNHFGIKCHKWAGEAVEYDDSLQHDCYRKYGSAEDSFLDHSRFLNGKRYASLHDLDTTDYHGWAHGLRQCGYAEDPAYPQKLIALIERYSLHMYDSIAMQPLPKVAVKDNKKDKKDKKADKKARQRDEVPAPPPRQPKEKPVVPPRPKPETAAPSRQEQAQTELPAGNRRTQLELEPEKKSAKRPRNQRGQASGKPLTGNADNPD